MKIRSDFVSNSSSSSFIFSVDFRKYDFPLFVKNVCDQCDGGENDIKTRSENEAILSYYINKYELLYVGRIVTGRKKETYTRKEDSDQFDEFEMIKNYYIDSKPNFNDEERPSAKLISENVIEYEFDELSPAGITVSREYMESVIRDRWSYRRSDDKAGRKRRVDAIFELIKQVSAFGENAWKTPFYAETYCITKNTIANTRDLIASGFEVRIPDSHSLDALEARLNAGETIFHTVCADAGEGKDDSRLFSNFSQFPFKDIPLEHIPNE